MADSHDTIGLSESPEKDRYNSPEFATAGFLKNFDAARALVLNRVQQMDFEELMALFKVSETLSEVMTAFSCQPRLKKEDTDLGVVYNDAGNIINAIEDSFSWLSELVAITAAKKEAVTSAECELRGSILVEDACRADEFGEIASIALQASLAVASAKQREARSERRSKTVVADGDNPPGVYSPAN